MIGALFAPRYIQYDSVLLFLLENLWELLSPLMSRSFGNYALDCKGVAVAEIAFACCATSRLSASLAFLVSQGVNFFDCTRQALAYTTYTH